MREAEKRSAEPRNVQACAVGATVRAAAHAERRRRGRCAQCSTSLLDVSPRSTGPLDFPSSLPSQRDRAKLLALCQHSGAQSSLAARSDPPVTRPVSPRRCVPPLTLPDPTSELPSARLTR